MLRYEGKKLFFYRKGIWLILFFLALELLGTLLFTKTYDRTMEEHRQIYEDYLKQVEGPLTQEKRDDLESEMARLNTAHMEMESLRRNYYLGHVDEETYRRRFEELLPTNDAYPGFVELYTQYIYVREAPEQRYFLYPGGWESLLTDQEPDYLLLLLLIILLTPMFCEEYSSRMDQLLLAQKRSAGSQAFYKTGLAALTAVVLTTVIQVFHLVYCAAVFGLPHGDYPLQSLVSFGGSVKALNLWQAFGLQFALKLLGYLYAAMLILALSVLLRKFALTLTAGIVLLPLPFLTVTNNHVFLRVPGPWALTLGSIYLNGSGTYYDGGRFTEVRELEFGELGIYTAAVCALLLLGLWYLWRKNSNAYLTGRPRRRLAALCAALLFAGLLTGCGGEDAERTVYNSTSDQLYATDRYAAIVSYAFPLTLIERETGVRHELPLDAHSGVTAFGGYSVYGRDNQLYYFKTVRFHPEVSSEGIEETVSLMALDLDTLSETTVYEWDSSIDWFFGLLDRPGVENTAGAITSFFLRDGYLYYADSFAGSELSRMNLLTGQTEIYLSDISLQFSYDGERLYYTDGYNRLVVYDMDSRQARAIDEVVTTSLALIPRGLCYLNARDSNTLYRWDEAARTVHKLSDVSATALWGDENFLWMRGQDGNLYRCAYDGSGLVSLAEPQSSQPYIPPVGDTLYYLDYMDDTLYQVDKNTLSVQILA